MESTLDYIATINSAYLRGSDEYEICKRIRSIHCKLNNPKLYLAVVGEFSSGKSTFINALLGTRLLKEAVMPTTACATYIEGHSKNLAIRVSFFDGAEYSSTETNFYELADYINAHYNIKCDDVNQLITVLTSEQTVAKEVKGLTISVPTTHIPRNVVIIDTPGFNPGSSSVDNHQEITRDVVENIADAAIILTPQEQAMSVTLSRFLNQYLKRCLHRCIYVITKFDILDDEHSRKEVYDYTKTRIITDLEITSPTLYGLSAVTMLPVKSIPIGKETVWPLLKKAFTDFIRNTWKELQNSKEYVLSEHINILVKDVARLCVEKLSQKESVLRDSKLFLEEHRVDAIQDVCNKMVNSANDAILTEIRNIYISFSTAESNSKRAASETINNGTMTLLSFKTVMMPQIKTSVETEAQNALSSLNSSINKTVRSCAKKQIRRMSDVFSSHYAQFPSLRPTEKTPSIDLVKFKNPDLNFGIALSKIEALDSKENKAAGGGAAGGAGIGFLIGGPIGALIGAGIGVIGGFIAGDQSDSMRSSAIPLVHNEISSFFSSLRIKVDGEVRLIQQKYLNLLQAFAKQHITKYGDVVQQLIIENQNQISELNNQIKNLSSAILGLQNVQDDIEHELAILKIK